jgi:hypothetical protein
MNAAINAKKCVIPVFKLPDDYQAYRISPESTNWLAIVFDPMNTRLSLTYCVEIYELWNQLSCFTSPSSMEAPWQTISF